MANSCPSEKLNKPFLATVYYKQMWAKEAPVTTFVANDFLTLVIAALIL
jgi:hypothetical protein